MQATSPITDAPVAPVLLLMDESFIEKAIEFIGDAKSRIWICAYSWKWYENHPEKKIQQFNYRIAKKSIGGVEVRAILDNPAQARSLRNYGIATKIYPTNRVLHSKIMLIDDKTLIIGSHNLTERGTSENFETSVAIQQPELCLEFEEYYRRMWDNYAEEPAGLVA